MTMFFVGAGIAASFAAVELMAVVRGLVPRYFAAQAMMFGNFSLMFVVMGIFPDGLPRLLLGSAFGLAAVGTGVLHLVLQRKWRRGLRELDRSGG